MKKSLKPFLVAIVLILSIVGINSFSNPKNVQAATAPPITEFYIMGYS
ncbi:hypothetical protein CPAST_c27320 [Clostridium pasteurianum DSM 525 = ATCC 6013]|uniref:Uncharacterized protein n=1 Tax=Clostridium pasteurianum DSM 525 = ATCC 6013 TaxID=1262449 RepID=A0A0H3J5S1_CLOPA|nr:hypothetical protein [Clostridium pasteurianum]AJA48799.1 hypothetical protein CPAST_c27320 [Clostridium pasteurianum DSM 525 = ATCC 6013]AJA52787.1 hypothetical protein CLPA_c27320 [Clostridium pasteurianum DSM 525 = ATCC 6013]KRU11205.1 hypothetical protein CP6013_00452 [Clostridium pasteurianum DSM 525 = ATCC 6013]